MFQIGFESWLHWKFIVFKSCLDVWKLPRLLYFECSSRPWFLPQAASIKQYGTLLCRWRSHVGRLTTRSNDLPLERFVEDFTAMLYVVVSVRLKGKLLVTRRRWFLVLWNDLARSKLVKIDIRIWAECGAFVRAALRQTIVFAGAFWGVEGKLYRNFWLVKCVVWGGEDALRVGLLSIA